MFDYTEIYHHGVKGQKWGVRRYQKKNGTRTSLGKKHQKTLNREAEKKQLDEDTIASLKNRLLKGRRSDSGELDARSLYQYRSKFTDKELQDFNNRFNIERTLGGYAAGQKTKGEKFVAKLKETASNVLWNAAQETAKNFIADQMKNLLNDTTSSGKNNNDKGKNDDKKKKG